MRVTANAPSWETKREREIVRAVRTAIETGGGFCAKVSTLSNPGWPQLLIFDRRIAMLISCKGVTETQAAVLDRLTRCGWTCLVATNLNQAVEALE